jgi:hypothetical protein
MKLFSAQSSSSLSSTVLPTISSPDWFMFHVSCTVPITSIFFSIDHSFTSHKKKDNQDGSEGEKGKKKNDFEFQLSKCDRDLRACPTGALR